MDFYKIRTRSKAGKVEVYPDFTVGRSNDLMVRGKSFYAIWDEAKGLWSTDEYDVQRLVDDELREYAKKIDGDVKISYMSDFSNNSWLQFRSYLSHVSDNSHQLDENLTFSNTEVKKEDYVSKRLPYALQPGDHRAYDYLISVLYEPPERRKLEWAIGAIVAGDAKHIQKCVVLYGAAGAGKSTWLNIAQWLFDGYYTTFESKALTGANNAFATEMFRGNPLVAIQHDGDLSHIEDNTKLNSIVSHEKMTFNEKYKPGYSDRVNAFLLMGTNRPVKITDAKSGIIRRLIDVQPSGLRINPKKYQALMSQIKFELGPIAYHCLEVYRELGQDYYSTYIPIEMILQTDVFYNFIEANYDEFAESDGVSLKRAYTLYKEFCDETLIQYRVPQYKFREELKNYFNKYEERVLVGSQRFRSYYSEFKSDKFKSSTWLENPVTMTLDQEASLLDDILANQPAQYATAAGIPAKPWKEVTTTLRDIDTTKLHYVKVPENHIVIDFDLKDDKGEKSQSKNLEEASKWPVTYAELSKSGAGVHLHYNYVGPDLDRLSSVYSEGIEVKVYRGDSALRRQVSKCNDVLVAEISSGLPLREDKVLNFDVIQNEKAIRTLIAKNIRKEIHPGTKPSIDFIDKILSEAYSSGMSYDVTDLRPKVLEFAMNSSNQAPYCMKLVAKMPFCSEEYSPDKGKYDDSKLSFFDCEVFQNLFVICWKYENSEEVQKMINPSAEDVELLMRLRLIGFNCRKYDNHILYGRYMGYNNYELYLLSQKLIANDRDGTFREAYNISYTDVYDFASTGNKKSLKKFEIELGIHHQELDIPWDSVVPPERFEEVADYCANDVIATEEVFHHLSGDWAARQILAEISGLSVNDTTNAHSTRIIFGTNKHPQSAFVYTDLSKMFTGYVYDYGKSSYRGEETGEGGYVYSEPGIYENVVLLDAESLHPTSIEQLMLFGPEYTAIFSEIKQGRIDIKHKDWDAASKILNGKLAPFVKQIENGTATYSAKNLSDALKTVINSVYGLTSASFDNPFRDIRNVDNIVAKRGALFMIDLKHAVQERGFTVAHIKTDSIKIPNATPEIIQFVMEFGKKYGYNFANEATYEKMCLVNDAVYIAKYSIKDGEECHDWTATGAQFAYPYVFKTLFSREPIIFEDLCETKSVTTSLWLDFNEPAEPDEHDYRFVGKTGAFCPMMPGSGGGLLLRKKDDSYSYASGCKGYRWMEAEQVRKLGYEEQIDRSYFIKKVDEARDAIEQFGDTEVFLEGD